VATFVHSFLTRPAGALTASVGTVGDPEGTRTITSLIALLVALGLGLVMLAVWLHRATRPDPEVLAPLEVMGNRKWRRADPVWQRRRLDELRPVGAMPLEPSVAPPLVDEAFDRGPQATGFDDLHDAVADSSGTASDDGAHAASEPESDRAGVVTPTAIVRPTFDNLPDGDVPADELAVAMAELDAELGTGTAPAD
jgi:hypothetical protein